LLFIALLPFAAPVAAQDSIPAADTTQLAAPRDSAGQGPFRYLAETDSLGRPIINYIEIRQSDVFDSAEARHWLPRVVNGLHIVTARRVVDREILLHPGEAYDSARVAETARHLRALGVFSKIRIDTVTTDTGFVLKVFAQDGWSTQTDFRFRSAGKQTDWQAALPVLTTLRHRTGEMVHVAVLDRLEVVYVERLESHHMLPVFRRVGHRLPAHLTSSGKALLAALPRDVLEARLEGHVLVARTPKTITNRTALLAELDRVARRGWASNIEEGQLGVSSVGAPVRGPDGAVMAAVSVVGDVTRLRGAALHQAAALVVEAAAVISGRLGYRSPRR